MNLSPRLSIAISITITIINLLIISYSFKTIKTQKRMLRELDERMEQKVAEMNRHEI